MDKQLIVLASTYPIDSNDVFLEKELAYLQAQFDEICIIPTDVSVNSKKSYHKNGINFEIRTFRCSFTSIILSIFNTQFVHVVRELIDLKNHRQLTWLKFKVLLNSHCKALQIAKLTAGLIKHPKETVCYSYWGDTAAISLAYLKQMNPDIIALSRFHGWDLYEERANESYLPLRAFTWNRLDFLILISKHGLSYLTNKVETRNLDKCRVEYLGVAKAQNLPQLGWTSTKKLISIVNSSEVKRLDRLVRVIDHLKGQISLEWTVVGVSFDHLVEVYTKMNLKPIENCHCTGVLTNDQVIQLYEEVAFDALLSLSDSEGIPFSMMEAMVHETPVLSTDVGGVSELVQRGCGLLFPVQTTDEFIASSIVNWLNRPKEARISERNQARQFVETHFLDEANFGNFACWLASLKSSSPNKSAS